jgi:hypothetical protein
MVASHHERFIDLHSNNHWEPTDASKYLAALDEYKDTVVQLFPGLKMRILDNRSIHPVDAMIVGFLLEYHPRKAVVLEIGSFVGASTFCFASHPKVSRVISVDPNPMISDELVANSDVWVGRFDPESLKDLRVFDVARATFAKFGVERQKVQFCEGVVGITQIGAKEGYYVDQSKKIDVPTVDTSENADLIALVDGLHTREGVQADLAAIFDQDPNAVALMDDCRHAWGPYVQAGVVDFVQQASDKYRFDLIGDLGPGLATSNLGIVYPHSRAAEVRKTLDQVRELFSQRLDPLRLLSREEELISIINNMTGNLQQLRKNNSRLKVQASHLQERESHLEKRNADLITQVSRLKERTEQLATHYSSKRYVIADAAVEKVLRIPGLKSLRRRNTA